MTEIKRLLKEYLGDDGIVLAALSEKSDDIRWQIKKGYREDFITDGRGFKSLGKVTEKGKKYFDEHNKSFEYHFHRYRKTGSTEEKELTLQKKLRQYVKNNPDVNAYEGLSENERFAFRNIFKSC